MTSFRGGKSAYLRISELSLIKLNKSRRILAYYLDTVAIDPGSLIAFLRMMIGPPEYQPKRAVG